MNKTMTKAEIDAAVSVSHVAMTRREKLLRWAKLVRKSKVQMQLYHLLENESQETLNKMAFSSGTAFALAHEDPILRDAGLDTHTIGGLMAFFEITKDDLHDFSCNCGGKIDNAKMASRIEKIAHRDGGPRSFFARMNPFG